MRILVTSPQGFATDALRSMLTALDSNCEVDVIDDFPSRLLSPPIPPSPAPDLVVVDVDGASVDVNAIVRECLLRYPGARLVALGSRLDDAYVEQVLEAARSAIYRNRTLARWPAAFFDLFSAVAPIAPTHRQILRSLIKRGRRKTENRFASLG